MRCYLVKCIIETLVEVFQVKEHHSLACLHAHLDPVDVTTYLKEKLGQNHPQWHITGIRICIPLSVLRLPATLHLIRSFYNWQNCFLAYTKRICCGKLKLTNSTNDPWNIFIKVPTLTYNKSIRPEPGSFFFRLYQKFFIFTPVMHNTLDHAWDCCPWNFCIKLIIKENHIILIVEGKISHNSVFLIFGEAAAKNDDGISHVLKVLHEDA